MRPLITTQTIDTGLVQDGLYAAKTHTVNFFLWKTGEGIICFDSGFDPTAIGRALKRLNLNPSDIAHLFLTHSDIDHVGGIRLFPNAQVYLSADEEPMVLHQATRLFGIYHNRHITRPYRLLWDGDTMTVAGLHIKTVSTPGHSRFNVLYVNNSILLRAKRSSWRTVSAACPRYTMNALRQVDSIHRLRQARGIDLICTGTWGLSRDWRRAFLAYPK